MNSRTAVIIPTKGRPKAVSTLLDALAQQTVHPDVTVISASDRSDIAQSIVDAKNVEVLFGPPGLTAQRNRALSLVRGKCDIVIFFDDDFIPSRYWIERVQMVLATQSDVVCVTGQVLKDGVTVGGLDWSEGQSIVNKADFSKTMVTVNDYKIQDHRSPYGCNMAFRAGSIEDITFDERLVLYGWLEDRDFAFRAGAKARMIWTDAIWGVHLGIKCGRASGLKFGYSQVVNPWYLMKKGSMTPFEVSRNIFRGIAVNAFGRLFQNSHIDRYGRLKGNIIGIKDIMFGRWAPERIADL
jgi:glycosyltransferase involved in cell wall biosynthesis